MNNNAFFSTDCHSHILPCIDDGSKSADMSVEMIRRLYEQGIRRVVATPHFRSHNDTVREFCFRRNKAFCELCDKLEYRYSDMVYLGSEVALEYGLSEVRSLPKLAYEGTNYILLEFPYRPFERWMTDEIMNIAYGYSLVPVIAHIDRYAERYSADDYEEIFSMDNVIFQINNEAFLSKQSTKIVNELIKRGLPFVLGSDCHNTETRCPNFDVSLPNLSRYSPAPAAQRFIDDVFGQ